MYIVGILMIIWGLITLFLPDKDLRWLFEFGFSDEKDSPTFIKKNLKYLRYGGLFWIAFGSFYTYIFVSSFR